ncbi:Homeodomain-like protein, partial [Schizopora paradoxa]
MTSGSPLSDDLRGVLVFMHVSRSLDAKTISQWTGVPKRTVFRVLSNWRKTGGVKQVTEEKRGRPRALDFADTKFIMGTVNRYNDRYLDELKDMLEERCNVKVSESTIWRTLNRVGFRMKMVRV